MMERAMRDQDDFERLREDFEAAGQGHVFERIELCTRAEREFLCRRLQSFDLSLCKNAAGLISAGVTFPQNADIQPVKSIPAPSGPDDPEWREAVKAGAEAVRAGRVAAFLAAGGQGTRLGFDGPKGKFPIGPVTGRSLFAVFAQSVLANSAKARAPIPLAVMVSPENECETRDFFGQNRYFGLRPDDVRFFTQATVPTFDGRGRILMESRCRAMVNPDGHGGALKLLVSGEAGSWLQTRGADIVYYFQVDNPALPVPDPGFIGHHILSGSHFTTKVVDKTGPEERMGVMAMVDGVSMIVEYIHMPADLAKARTPDGRLKFAAGNVAVHAIDLSHLANRFPKGVPLPFHVARKQAEALAPGKSEDLEEVEAYKMETFIFDVLPLLDRVLAVECRREDEFAPVKASSGEDTPENARRILSLRAARWLLAAGARVPLDCDGLPLHPIEISPLTALEPSDLIRRMPAGMEINGPLAL